MKLFFFLALMIACSLPPLLAQTNSSDKRLKYGIKTGLSLSTFTKDVDVFAPWSPGLPVRGFTDYRKYFRISSLIGFVGQYQISPSFAIGAELLYAGKGAAYRKVNHDVVTISEDGAKREYDYFRFKIGYLEVPVTVNWILSPKSKSKSNFSLYAGVAPAFATDRKTSFHSYETNSGTPIPSRTVKSGDLKYVRSFNLGAVGGFRISGKREGSLFFDGRINGTLLPVFKYATNDDGYNLNTAMLTPTLAVGINL